MKVFCLYTLLCFATIAVHGQSRFDLLIDEIMADPSPAVGLPANEWIELRNTSAMAINLLNWRIGDASGQSGLLPDLILQPDSFVIVCAATALPLLRAFGPAVAVTAFPSLDNEGETIYIRAPGGGIVHALSYSSSWYGNELKKEGGWSLEMIDTKNPCGGKENWTAATHPDGGTPGRRNSVDGIQQDLSPPRLQKVYARDSVTLILVFDETLDSLAAALPANYTIDGGPGVVGSHPIAPLWNEVELTLATPLAAGVIFTITVHDIKDCSGNNIGDENKIRTGLPAEPVAGDWVINEILFNPRSNGTDYVELYNNSNKILDAATLSIANRGSNGAIGSIKPVSGQAAYLFPGEYLVLTEDAAVLSINYLVRNEKAVFVLPSLPSFPDDGGDVIILDAQGQVIDEVKYDKGWHFKLVDNPEGISLERIDPTGPSQEASNWHSAASTAGYGTPGYANSQLRGLPTAEAGILVSPSVFSPDNDGRDDIATISYKVVDPGCVANLTIFDAAGRSVRQLVRNNILGSSGYWNWDGLNDKGQALPAGIYIVYTEIFNLQGRRMRFKNAVVVAREKP